MTTISVLGVVVFLALLDRLPSIPGGNVNLLIVGVAGFGVTFFFGVVGQYLTIFLIRDGDDTLSYTLTKIATTLTFSSFSVGLAGFLWFGIQVLGSANFG